MAGVASDGVAGFDGRLRRVNFAMCKPGGLWLDDDELAWIRERFKRDAQAQLLPLSVEICPDVDSVTATEPPPASQPTPGWIASRSRSRSRSPGNRGADGANGARGPLPAGATDLRTLSGDDLEAMQLEVKEVENIDEKEAARNIHLKKNTFHEERELVKMRIFEGDRPHIRCRTWVLTQLSKLKPVPPDAGAAGRGGRRGGGRGGRGKQTAASKAAAASCAAAFLAATTVRINQYEKRQGRWAQILNMSTKRERHGHGTVLIAGLEELLKREDVDVVVLYPADNGRAMGFWSSLGFGQRDTSLLPDEELVPHEDGGPLLPEFDPGSRTALPRWEKRIGQPLKFKRQPSTSSVGSSKRRRRQDEGEEQPQEPHRALDASLSRVGGKTLQTASQNLLTQRANAKARWAEAADNKWGSMR